MAGSTSFLGVSFATLDLAAAAKAVRARAWTNAPFAYVVTPNVDHVVKLAREPQRAPLYEGAWLRLNDSRVLARLAKASGVSIPVAPGSDLTERLLCGPNPWLDPITVIGGDAGLIEDLKARTGLQDVRWFAPPMGLARRPDLIVQAADFAARQRTGLTFLCVGAPQQEMIAWAMAQRGDAVGVALCVGASLEFVAGRTPRAPYWMRRAGLEWLHRLTREPRRLWRRYLVEGPAVFSLWLRWRAAHRSAPAAPPAAPRSAGSLAGSGPPAR